MSGQPSSPFVSRLFLDNRWIADSTRVTRVWHTPRKVREPILLPDPVSEENAIVGYGSILFHQGRFHLWYITWTRLTPLRVAYATSEDGINFVKPELGLYEIRGSRQNNVCLMAEPHGDIDSLSVILDEEDSTHPFKALLWQGFAGPKDGTGMPAHRGISSARSRDGIHWEVDPGFVLPGWGDRMTTFTRKVDGKFVLYGRAENFMRRYNNRIVYRSESEDLRHWSTPQLILKSDEEDPPALEIYSLQTFPYAGLYLGTIERMHCQPDKVDAELVYSEDTIQWHRSRSRAPFLPTGNSDTWDCAWANVIPGSPILYRGSLLFYYGGRSSAHKTFYPLHRGAIGLAVLRPDGFVSLQAANREGWVLTPPFDWPVGADLGVNADPRADLTTYPGSASGEVRVEVLNEEGEPIPGFSREACQPITFTTHHETDQRKKIYWDDTRSLSVLGGRKIVLKFYLRDAHLFSFAAVQGIL